MAEPKTQRTKASVAAFLNAVEPPRKRDDAKALDKIFRAITVEKPAMWGDAIVGYGEYSYVYGSGHSGVWPRTGFSPRKANLTLYVMMGFADLQPLLAKLGKHQTAKSCLYINTLADVDEAVLRAIIARGWDAMNAAYPKTI